MEAAPLHNDVADAPPGGAAWWVRAADAVRIRVAAWPPAPGAPTRGTLLLFPGRTEYIEKYGRVAQFFSDQGFAVLTLDWRGQGLTERVGRDPRLGHVLSFAEYQHDVAALLDLARDRALPEPFFLLSHSMGGCIALRALQGGLPVRAAVFSAPMWGIRLEPWERPLAWTSALLGPLLGLGHKLTPRTTAEHLVESGAFEGNELTTDRAAWDFMKAQTDRYPELALGGPTIFWLRAALIETARLARLASPQLPALTFLGTGERIVAPARIRRRMARWPGGRLELLPGAEHEILMERPEIRTPVLDAAAALFRRHA